ncbi:MAG TPA: SH3 domain-containing protein [Candidatus Angelobacter sp.]|nr:SH3 domain-containing protein [Candidatus Angelobacter sp.]
MMKAVAKYILLAFLFLSPSLVNAQSTGQVACTRSDNYSYLYSSMTTLDVLRTLQCGEQLDILGRYDGYFGVRTSKGEIGYVPQGSVSLFKDKPGPKAPQAAPAQPARPRTAYDVPAATPPAPANPVPAGFDLTLPNGTPVHLKLGKTLSSETARVGDVVDLTVEEDVLVDGVCVIATGSSAVGIVTEAEPKKRMGHGGKLGLGINFVQLADKERAAVRSFQESSGANSSAGTVIPIAHGKEVVFAQGMEITAYVDGDVYLKRSAFLPSKDAASPAATAQNPSQPHKR